MLGVVMLNVVAPSKSMASKVNLEQIEIFASKEKKRSLHNLKDTYSERRNIQHDDILNDDTQHNELYCITQPSIVTLIIRMECHCVEIVMLNVNMLSSVMLGINMLIVIMMSISRMSVIMTSVIMMSVIMTIVIMLNAVMLNVIMLSINTLGVIC